MRRLPIGIQDFPSIRNEGYIYIDKTQYLHTLIHGPKYQFVSRPRRFGKSLMISTLKSIFEGKKELFEGLWLEHHHDFKPRPVIRLDFSRLYLLENRLEESLVRSLRQTAAEYNLELKSDTARFALEDLILELAKRDRVVILIDEYDKPMTDYIENDAENLKIRLEYQKILRSIYGLFKPLGEYIHLVVMTGVSKIGKLSLFSDLNNLRDISLDKKYAQLFGYTRAEIEQYFPEYLKLAWASLDLLEGEFWDIVKFWYNGYSWDGENQVYCPFSFLLFLESPDFKGYWYETGTPTFLIKMIQQENINPLEFEQIFTGETTLNTFNLEHMDPISIMFQTGYLTIKSIEKQLGGINYELSYPNQEVRKAFSKHILELYSGKTGSYIESLGFQVQKSLKSLEWTKFFEAVKAAYASIPSIISSKEKHFHALFHMLMCATGLPVYSELLTNKGRMDTLVDTRAFYVIFEFKMSGTAQAALEQITEKDYAERFTTQQPVYKVGVVFDETSRNVKDWMVG
jgi:hypothetical protein